MGCSHPCLLCENARLKLELAKEQERSARLEVALREMEAKSGELVRRPGG